MADVEKVVDDFRMAMFEHHDAGAAASLYAEDATYSDPEVGTITGREAIKQLYEGYLKAFPDMKGEVTTVLVAGNLFAAEAKLSGTHSGPLEVSPDTVIPPSGKPMEFSIAWFGRVNEEGLFTEDRTYYDPAIWRAQIGLEEQEKGELGEAAAAA